MNIIITKQNQEFFKEQLRVRNLNVVDQTANTLTVKITANKFHKLYVEMMVLKQNPYALMSW